MCRGIEFNVVQCEYFSNRGGGVPARAPTSKSGRSSSESEAKMWVRNVIPKSRLSIGIVLD